MTDAHEPSPTLAEIRTAHDRLRPWISRTPTWAAAVPELSHAQPIFKLELLQHTGSFKVRAALLRALDLDAAARDRGVTAVSAGNHALALAWAAAKVGTTAKVVMPKTANPVRVAGCRRLGAEVVLVDHVHAAFAAVDRIVAEEGRTFVHPFEGPTVALGTAGVGSSCSRTRASSMPSSCRSAEVGCAPGSRAP
jgi:threonine dehydratase